MDDSRMNLLKSIEGCLFNVLDFEEAQEISQKITIILGDFKVSKCSTDIVVPDSANEKIIKLYCNCLVIDGKSQNTIYQYQRAIRKLNDYVCKPFSEMGVYDIRLYLASEKERGCSDRSVENIRSYLSAFFTWMTSEGMIPKNPMANIKSIGYHEEIKEAFSEVEIDKLRTACKTAKERAILEMLIATGVRVSELSAMNVCDIDSKNLEVKVVHGKGDVERITYITPVAMTHLEKYLETRPEQEALFLFANKGHTRLRPNGIRFILERIANRANINNVHPHRFRRTFATMLARRGMDIREIQSLMGHKNINTTMIYVCNDKEGIKASYKKYVS